MSSTGLAFSDGTSDANFNAKGPSNPPVPSLPIEDTANPELGGERKIENAHKSQSQITSPPVFVQEAPATFAPSISGDGTRTTATSTSAFSAKSGEAFGAAYPAGSGSTSEPNSGFGQQAYASVGLNQSHGGESSVSNFPVLYSSPNSERLGSPACLSVIVPAWSL